MNFFGNYSIETKHTELVTLIKKIIDQDHPGRLAPEEKKLFAQWVVNALGFYRLAHTSPINRFYRARFTKENGPELALAAKKELDDKIHQSDLAFTNAKKYLKTFLIDPFERKQKDSSFFGSWISDTSRIHYLLAQLKLHNNELKNMTTDLEKRKTPHPTNPSIQ